MPDRLAAYVRSFGVLGQAAADEQHTEEIRKAICAILLDQTGHDFNGYKTRTFYRRIERRMQVLQISSLEAYAARLRTDAGEVNTLFRDLLIGVTNFFRDAKAFEALEKLVLSRLFEKKGAQDTIRVWVTGCATGEEAYSLAFVLREHSEQARSRAKVQIFATDIDEAALAVARAGRYPDSLLEGVSKERLARNDEEPRIYRLTLDTVDKPNLQLIMFPGKMAAAKTKGVSPKVAPEAAPPSPWATTSSEGTVPRRSP